MSRSMCPQTSGKFRAYEEKSGRCSPTCSRMPLMPRRKRAAFDCERPRRQTKWRRGFVRIAIADRGHGISSDTKHNIFLPFFTTKERRGYRTWSVGDQEHGRKARWTDCVSLDPGARHSVCCDFSTAHVAATAAAVSTRCSISINRMWAMTICDFYSLATNRGSFPGSRAGRSWSSDSDGKYKARVLVVDDEEELIAESVA